jgi:hypothetical protein
MEQKPCNARAEQWGKRGFKGAFDLHFTTGM